MQPLSRTFEGDAYSIIVSSAGKQRFSSTLTHVSWDCMSPVVHRSRSWAKKFAALRSKCLPFSVATKPTKKRTLWMQNDAFQRNARELRLRSIIVCHYHYTLIVIVTYLQSLFLGARSHISTSVQPKMPVSFCNRLVGCDIIRRAFQKGKSKSSYKR